jgi:hypothetical protein
MKNLLSIFALLSFSLTANAISIGKIASVREISPVTIVYDKTNTGEYQIVSKTGGDEKVVEESSSGQMAEVLAALSGGGMVKVGDVVKAKVESTTELNQNKSVKIQALKSGKLKVLAVTALKVPEMGIDVAMDDTMTFDVTAGSLKNLGRGKLTVGASSAEIKKSLTKFTADQNAVVAESLTKFASPMMAASGYPGKVRIKSNNKILSLPKTFSCQANGTKLTCTKSSMKMSYEMSASWGLF